MEIEPDNKATSGARMKVQRESSCGGSLICLFLKCPGKTSNPFFVICFCLSR